MKDTGKRLCLPYLLSSQSHSPGRQLGHAPGAKPGRAVLARLLPLALTLGSGGRAAGARASRTFHQNQPSQDRLLSPIPAYLPEGVGGPGMPEASQNCTRPSGG